MKKSNRAGNRFGIADHANAGAPDEANRFYSIAEVAEQLGVCTRTVRRWIENKLLIVHRIKGVVRIAPTDLAAFLAAQRED